MGEPSRMVQAYGETISNSASKAHCGHAVAENGAQEAPAKCMDSPRWVRVARALQASHRMAHPRPNASGLAAQRRKGSRISDAALGFEDPLGERCLAASGRRGRSEQFRPRVRRRVAGEGEGEAPGVILEPSGPPGNCWCPLGPVGREGGGSWGLLGPPGTSRGFLKLPGASWGPLGPRWVSCGLLGRPVASWGLQGLPGASRGLLVPTGACRGILGPTGASWGLLGPPRVSWGFLAFLGASWGLLGLPGASLFLVWPPGAS